LLNLRCFTVLLGGWLILATSPARAAEAEVEVETKEGWVETTYVISMNKEAALKLRDGLDRVDPTLIGGALTGAAPHPALKIAIALATGNADAFKRSLNKEGTIGANGITITLTAYGGKLATYGQYFRPSTARMPTGPAADAMQIAVNPWSWSIAPRNR
jgi:hypothetical protein